MRKYFKLAINIPSIVWLIAKWFSIAWIENYIAPALEKLSEWTGIPMQFIEGLLMGIIAVASLWWLFGRYGRKQTDDAEESHKVYVAQKIVDSKADDLLALPNALQALMDLDIRLLNNMRIREIPKQTLIMVQSRLREDWKVRPPETYDSITIQTVKDVIKKTIKENKLKLTKEDEETMLFMLHVAGVLDDEKVGISKHREKDEAFKLVNRLKAKVATDRLRNAIRFFDWYSLGINSILLLIGYFPADAVQAMMRALGKTSTELEKEREQTLSYLLINVNALIKKELHGIHK